MTLREAAKIIEAEVLVGEDKLDQEISSVCGSDMMSEVLAFTAERSVLLTGLCNTQVLRTADMLDLICIVFIRGKQPTPEMLKMAEDDGRVVMTTRFGMFSTSGRLYKAGAGSGCM
ncbi:MAG: hypothetical protein IKI49_03620 [Oscillospiraceae bacterium]|nr:hypothetical protein [Oscillospiraceae bacterium]